MGIVDRMLLSAQRDVWWTRVFLGIGVGGVALAMLIITGVIADPGERFVGWLVLPLIAAWLVCVAWFESTRKYRVARWSP